MTTSTKVRSMRRSKYSAWLVASWIFVCGVGNAMAADSMTIAAEYLSRVRTSAEFIAVPGLAELVHKLNADQALGLVVRYPGGEAGQIWGGRIESWLVAHGLSSSRIVLEVGSNSEDGVEIILRPVP